jgi:general secretion pathway protein G
MSDCCRATDRRQAGFTLLETLIALTLLAIVGALVAPGLTRLADRARLAEARDRLERALVMAPGAARAAGASADLVAVLTPHLPPGWRLLADPPILVREDGACAGGRLSAVAPSARIDWRLTPPFCRPVRE